MEKCGADPAQMRLFKRATVAVLWPHLWVLKHIVVCLENAPDSGPLAQFLRHFGFGDRNIWVALCVITTRSLPRYACYDFILLRYEAQWTVTEEEKLVGGASLLPSTFRSEERSHLDLTTRDEAP